MGCAQSRGPEEMACLFITHPTGIWVHCDEGHKMCGLPMSRNLTRVPLHLHVATRQGSVLEGKPQHVVGELATGACLVHTWVGQEWSPKGSEPLISRRKKKIPTVCHSAKGKTLETIKKMSGCQEFAERSIQSTDILMSSESTLSDITVMDICGHTFVQTHSICNTALLIKVNPKVNWECFDYVSM